MTDLRDMTAAEIFEQVDWGRAKVEDAAAELVNRLAAKDTEIAELSKEYDEIGEECYWLREAERKANLEADRLRSLLGEVLTWPLPGNTTVMEHALPIWLVNKARAAISSDPS